MLIAIVVHVQSLILVVVDATRPVDGKGFRES
jgi:hypothetical protein